FNGRSVNQCYWRQRCAEPEIIDLIWSLRLCGFLVVAHERCARLKASDYPRPEFAPRYRPPSGRGQRSGECIGVIVEGLHVLLEAPKDEEGSISKLGRQPGSIVL